MAFVKATRNQLWYCFDDDQVREIDEANIKTANAYLLFYVRKDMLSVSDSGWPRFEGWSISEEAKKSLQHFNGSEEHARLLEWVKTQKLKSSSDCSIL